MFQFSGFAHLTVCHVFNMTGCPIQISADQIVCANPRSFSQLITSFIASESLGIPHTPLFCLLCSIFNQKLIKCALYYYYYNIFLLKFVSQYVNELVL